MRAIFGGTDATPARWLGRRAGVLLVGGVLAAGVGPVALAAQEEDLSAQCESQVPPGDAQQFCKRVAQAVEIVQPRLGIALSGGNPVPGTASTLGMRLGTVPRFSVAARVTGAWVELPPIREQGSSKEVKLIAPSIDVDAAIAVFGGFSPAPTLGGLASLDLLASVGVIPVPEGEGFGDERPVTWAVGARLGILRESFIAPGISVSAMYRRMNEVTYGDPALVDDDAFFRTDLSTLSLRGAVSKRLLFIGASAGVGYDKYTSDVAYGIRPRGLLTREFRFEQDKFQNDRLSAFANVSWTMLILHIVGELGWQQGADIVPGTSSTQLLVDPEKGALFGSLAFRLSI